MLKSRTRGYASFDYELTGYAAVQAGEAGYSCSTARVVDALSFIIHADKAYPRARRAMVEKLKENIPRQLFEVPDPGSHRRQDHCP